MKFATGILAAYFLLIGFFPHGDLCELRKMPSLYEHYQEHQEADGDTFFEFIYEDFLSDVGDQENHHGKDSSQKMPFQNHSAQSHCCNFIPLLSHGYEMENPPEDLNKGFSTYFFHYSFLYPDSIFQPPRF